MKKYMGSVVMFALFETVAITLWLTKHNLFYLLNFTYIGGSLAVGLALFANHHKHARRVVQFLVGTYMLVYLGIISNENMQIEGFWYYLFLGVFEAATIHYAVAKIFGPLFFGRGWCGYCCWTAMILDLLPYKRPQNPRKKIGRIRYIAFAASLLFVCLLFALPVVSLPGRQRAVLRRWNWAGFRIQGQPGVLQIHLSCNGIFKAHELFFPDSG